MLASKGMPEWTSRISAMFTHSLSLSFPPSFLTAPLPPLLSLPRTATVTSFHHARSLHALSLSARSLRTLSPRTHFSTHPLFHARSLHALSLPALSPSPTSMDAMGITAELVVKWFAGGAPIERERGRKRGKGKRRKRMRGKGKRRKGRARDSERVRERFRDRETETDRERQRQTERQRERETETEREKEKERKENVRQRALLLYHISSNPHLLHQQPTPPSSSTLLHLKYVKQGGE
jgi:hypothetical protein